MGLIDTLAARLGYIKTQRIDEPAAWLQSTATHYRWDNLFDFSTDEQHLATYTKLSWVLTAVSSVAQLAATTGLQVMELAGEKRNEVPNHPFELLLQRPNPLMSRYELLESTFIFRALTGNAYWWLNRSNENAPPDEIWVLPSQYLKPVPDERMYLRGYIYDTGDGGKVPLDLHEVVHFRRFNPLNPFTGLSPLESLRFATRGDMAQQAWNLNYFDKDNAKMPGALAFAAPIDEPEWERMKADIREQHGGTNRNLMMLRGVGDRGVTWVSMAMSQRDMQFIEGRTFTKEEIFGVYAPGLSSMLAVNATEANSIAGRKTFTEMGVWPHLVAVAEKITNDVLPAYGRNLLAEFDDIRVTDRAMELQEQRAYADVHTVDEVRQRFFDAEPLGDDRGKLLVAEIGRGITPTEAPQQPDMQSILAQLNRGDNAVDPQSHQDAQSDRHSPDNVANAPQNDAQSDNRQAMQAEKRREEKAFRKWLKRRPNPDIAQFDAEYLSDAEKADIAAEFKTGDGDAEDTPFFVTLPTDGRITLDWWRATKATLQLSADDPEAEQAARMAIERRASREMSRSLEEWLTEALDGLSDAEVQSLAYRLRNNQATFRDVLQRALVQSSDLGVSVALEQFDNVGYGFDYTLVNAGARNWARRYTDDLLAQLNTTNDKIVGEAVARWIDNGEPLSALEMDLRPYFGRQRAQMIASTEVTRAYAEANRIAYEQSGVVETLEWRTANDERVCPICGPLGGIAAENVGTEQPKLGGGGNARTSVRNPQFQHPNGMVYGLPPAHPRCRCWIVPVVAEVGEATGAVVQPPEWAPSMSRQTAEQWVQNSSFPADTYHITSGVANERAIIRDGFDLSKEKFGRMWGDGVYVGVDEETANGYRKWTGRSARKLTIKLNVQNVYTYEEQYDNFKQSDILMKAMGLDGNITQNKIMAVEIIRDKGLSGALSDLGYDALHIIPRPSGVPGAALTRVGGNQIVVFDPKKVVVIND